MLILSFSLIETSQASYVLYSIPEGSIPSIVKPNQTTISTGNNNFYYSDGRGNSMSYTEKTYIPVIVTQYANSQWTWMNNGKVPINAVVLRYVNGFPTYYCRVQMANQLYYGELIPYKGCVVKTSSGISAFNLYQALQN